MRFLVREFLGLLGLTYLAVYLVIAWPFDFANRMLGKAMPGIKVALFVWGMLTTYPEVLALMAGFGFLYGYVHLREYPSLGINMKSS